jgi:hypothetical protein
VTTAPPFPSITVYYFLFNYLFFLFTFYRRPLFLVRQNMVLRFIGPFFSLSPFKSVLVTPFFLYLICIWPCIFNVGNAIKSRPTRCNK